MDSSESGKITIEEIILEFQNAIDHYKTNNVNIWNAIMESIRVAESVGAMNIPVSSTTIQTTTQECVPQIIERENQSVRS
jgi:hypothetical protein